jgi:hypothetical protein
MCKRVTMDVYAFLRLRVAFIRQFYDSSASVFLEKKLKIESSDAPYEPYYSEESEPLYLSEWSEAEDSLEVLGHVAVSLLAASLQLFLKESVKNIFLQHGHKKTAHLKTESHYKKVFKKEGWIQGYKTYFLAELDIDWNESQCDLAMLEELVLARNRVQHPDDITSLHVRRSKTDMEKLPRFIFISEDEAKLLGKEELGARSWLSPPAVIVSPEKLHSTINEMEQFCSWLEENILAWK